jgi:hypothetical protein
LGAAVLASSVWTAASAIARPQESGRPSWALELDAEEEPGHARTATAGRSGEGESPDPQELGPSSRPLEDRILELESKVEEQAAQIRALSERPVPPPANRLRIGGYADVGFFVPRGDGSGVVQDAGNVRVPAFASRFGWVFLGDLLSTAVNSRGEVADLGKEPGVTRYDAIHSSGAAGFIVNEVNVSARAQLLANAAFVGSINFVPRTGSDFALGDFLDVDLALLEYLPLDDDRLRLSVGKIDPVFGIEYRERKANRRFGITPSLIARYTTGTQLGVGARSVLFDGWLLLAAQVTNGSSTIEMFHFYDETDSNNGKTLSGRMALSLPMRSVSPIFAGDLQVGVSVEWGAQDRARDSEGALSFIGADLSYTGVDLYVKAQLMQGKSPGRATDMVYSLDLHPSGYLEVDYIVPTLPMLGLLARLERRDALVTLGSDRAYLSKVWRLTGGVRLVLTPNIVVKAEYLLNGEYGEVPSISNDVFTSSLVMSY